MKHKIKEWLKANGAFSSKIGKAVLLLIALIGFLAIAENVWNKEIMKLDILGYKIISTVLISDFMTPIAKIITNFGSAMVLICISAISLLVVKNKKIGLTISVNLAMASGINFLLKNILQRPRPTEFRLIDESGYSFPSGHSMVSMAFYGFLIYLIYKYVKNKKLKLILITFLSLLIFSIGISRIYLGVHYTSDVIGGFLIAISYLVIYTRIVKRLVLESSNSKKIHN